MAKALFRFLDHKKKRRDPFFNEITLLRPISRSIFYALFRSVLKSKLGARMAKIFKVKDLMLKATEASLAKALEIAKRDP